MAATKSNTVVTNSATLTAGAGNRTDTFDCHTSNGGLLLLSLINGATGPTVAAQVQVQFSNDTNTHNYSAGSPLVGLTSNNGEADWCIEIPLGAMYGQLVWGSNTGQNVTARAEIAQATAVG